MRRRRLALRPRRTGIWTDKSFSSSIGMPGGRWSRTIHPAVESESDDNDNIASAISFEGETCCRSRGVGATHHDLVQPVEKVGTIPRVDFRRLEPGQTLEIGRGPFPNTSIMTVQRPSTRIHPGVRSPIHQVFEKEKKNQNPLLHLYVLDHVRPRFDLIGRLTERGATA